MATTAKPRKSTPAGRRTGRSTASSSAGKTTKSSVVKSTKASVTPKPAENSLTAPVTKGAAAAAKAAAPDTDAAKMKRGELLEAIAERSALKRSDLRVTLELVLDEIGKALDRGDELVLPPMGKLAVKRRKSAKNGDILVTRIKRSVPREEPLAEPGEDS